MGRSMSHPQPARQVGLNCRLRFNDTSELLLAILEELDPSSEGYAWVWGGLELGIEDFAATRPII